LLALACAPRRAACGRVVIAMATLAAPPTAMEVTDVPSRRHAWRQPLFQPRCLRHIMRRGHRSPSLSPRRHLMLCGHWSPSSSPRHHRCRLPPMRRTRPPQRSPPSSTFETKGAVAIGPLRSRSSRPCSRRAPHVLCNRPCAR
jgi:hypothetical protein